MQRGWVGPRLRGLERGEDASACMRAAGAVGSSFEAAVNLIDDRVMRRAQSRVRCPASRKKALVQMNWHYHGQAESDQ